MFIEQMFNTLALSSPYNIIYLKKFSSGLIYFPWVVTFSMLFESELIFTAYQKQILMEKQILLKIREIKIRELFLS